MQIEPRQLWSNVAIRAILPFALLLLPVGATAQVAEICGNGGDEDADARVDCEDSDCATLLECAGRALPSENTPRLCQNGADDDGDGRADCDDDSCAQLVFCVSRPGCADRGTQDCDARREPRHVEGFIYSPRVEEPRPEARFLPIEDACRYPQAHVRQPLTPLAGMLSPFVALALQPTIVDRTQTRLGLGASYAILDFWEVDVLAVPVQLSPSAEYFDPVIGSTLRILNEAPVEAGVRASVSIPVRAGDAGTYEPIPTSYRLGASRDGGVAALDLSAPILIHLAEIARIDVDAIAVAIVMSDPVRVDLSWPLRVTFQVSELAFVGVASGASIGGPRYDRPTVPLSFFVGTTIPATRRGPIAQARLSAGWPALFDPTQADPVAEQAWRITIEAELLTYLLP